MSHEPEDRSEGGCEIAVVGMAGRFPGAGDVDRFWSNLRAGVESVTYFDHDALWAQGVDEATLADPNYVAAQPLLDDIDRFDAAYFGIHPREAEIADPQQRLFLETAVHALEDAGHGGGELMTGIYAGCGMNQYLLYHLISKPEVIQAAGGLPVVLSNDKDYLATRASYKLDLEGPSLSVQTACSTSLVAVHLACQGLLDGDCDLALAGGVSIDLTPGLGYHYQQDGILSPDGRCRTFDAQAQGTIFGSGVGIVVLRRLEDALADGDRVRAIILGSAINNDGASKVGFTAPRVEGQAKVVRAALATAEVDPTSISYVEAHGTATPLGDPIEVEALRRAFRLGKDHQATCALGSVKPNVGHLDTAAGIAGLIKTVMALEHRELPPSLHYESPNPRIPFDDSPFFVNDRLRPWDAEVRRAGVSSFGIGGTNAHVIVEEAPSQPSSGPSRPWQLLTLQAASADSLERWTDDLAAHLEASEESLADVAFTLAVGRRSLKRRRILVARDTADAAEVLASRDRKRLLSHAEGGVAEGSAEDRRDRSLVFLFPGQGSQYPGMARALYDAEPIFRQQVDYCAERLQPALQQDLRSLLCFDPTTADEAAAQRAADELRQTQIAQAALFVVELALARQLEAWGLRPEVMIGHSIGEFVAAVLAEVVQLDDALALVAERGRLMQEQPTGAMLSVPLPSDELLARLPRTLSVAALNGPRMTVVAGPEAAIAEFAAELEAEDVKVRRLRTSHAFHSTLMNGAVNAFQRRVAQVRLSPPKLPYLSNVTGTWITPQEATDPGYWARHLRQTVRFDDGLRELFQDSDRALLEVGPGRSLSGLALSHPERPANQVVLSAGRHPTDDRPEDAALLQAIGSLWMAGVEPSWPGVYQGQTRRRVTLPAYPFDHQRYWIEGSSGLEAGLPAASDAQDPAAEPAGTEVSEAVVAGYARPFLGVEYEAPSNDLERRICGVWQEALGIEAVGIHDPFLELGGHSLLATQVSERLRGLLGVDLAVREFFEAETVAGLAELLAGRGPASGAQDGEGLPELLLDPEHRYEPFPLTEVQQAYWVGRSGSFELGNVATHVFTEIEGPGLSVEALERAWQHLVDRHDMLRCVVLPDGQQQVLKDLPPYRFEVLDLRDLEADEVEQRLLDLREQMSHQVLPSDRWPLFEIRASRLPNDRVRLHVSFDFLIGDAWSIQLLTRQWFALVQSPESSLLELELTFRDYVLAEQAVQESEVYRKSLAYWRERLPTLPAGPELPLLRDSQAVEQPTFVRRTAGMTADRWSTLKARAAEAGLTPSSLLLAAFSEVLATWSKSPRFLITLTLFRRLPLHPEVDDVVGDFTSLTLSEIGEEAASDGFKDRARTIQARLLNDLDHRYVSGVRVVRELTQQMGERNGPLVPVVFTSLLGLEGHDDAAPETESSGETGSETGAGFVADGGLEVVYAISQTPQVWIDHQVSEEKGALSYNWDAVDELFPAGLLGDMFDTYRQLLDDLADTDDWADFPCRLPTEQLSRRLAPAAPSDDSASRELMQELFDRQATADAERPAVLDGDRTVTYGELRRVALELGHRLRQREVQPGQLVAVAMRKGWEQAAAALGILWAGGAYLPVDPGLPRERFRHLLRRGEVSLAITQADLIENLDWPAEVSPLTLSDDPADAPEILQPVPGAEDLAYVIFTSGSTGEPKGVMIDHRGAVNTVLDINQRFDVGPEDRVLALSSLSFDLSVYDLAGLLAAGGAMVMPPPDSARRPDLWLQTMVNEGVTIWNTVPALMAMLVEHLEGTEQQLPASLRLVLMSGDWIPVSLPDRLRALAPNPEGLRLISLGGATEASIWSILYPIGEVDPEWPSIPYGRAMDRQRFYVLDERLEPRPDGVPGELYIGGVGVARGYWRDPERSAARFIIHPRTGERLYRTGDLGRWLDDGNIEFLGREDFQVKIQGYRIELGEIEAAMLEHPAVTAAAAIAVGERHHQRLFAFATPAASSAPGASPASGTSAVSEDDLRSHLEKRLPAYMVPAQFRILDALPLTSNGKVDRGALAQLTAGGTASDSAAAPPVAPLPGGPSQDRRLQDLAEIWSAVLGVENVGPEDNFFALGGDSILSIQIVSRARQVGWELTPDQLFLHPTLAELAAAAGGASADDATPSVAPVEDLPVTGAVPLTPIQHWFFEQELSRPAHWNQAVTLHLAQGADPVALRRAAAALVRHHDGLRLRFSRACGGWRQFNAPPDTDALPVSALDLSGLPVEQQLSVAAIAADALQASLDLTRGPLLRIATFDLGAAGTHLLLVFHHMVVDGVSWRILMHDLESAYLQATSGAEPVLPPKSASFKQWAETLDQRAWQGQYLDELEHWTAPRWRETKSLPLDFAKGVTENTEASVRHVNVELDPAETRVLLQETSVALRAQIQEILLAALAFALGRMTDGGPLAVDLETHGRGAVDGELDVSRTVGWLTAVYPLLFDSPPDATPEACLAAVKERLRSVPQSGVGYGVLRYLSPDPEVGDALRQIAPAEIAFNYFGQLDQVTGGDDSPFSTSELSTGPWNATGLKRRHLLFVVGSVTDGRLAMSFAHSRNVHRQSTIEVLATDFLTALRQLLAVTRDGAAATWVPSDFPLAQLEAGELGRVTTAASGLREDQIEDIYRLTPMQEGLLFHSLFARQQPVTEGSPTAPERLASESQEPALYVTTFACILPVLDAARFEASWQRVVDRHPVLRTAFVWRDLERAQQVVVRLLSLNWQRQDWRHLTPEEQRRQLAEARRLEGVHGLPMDQAPLLRLSLYRLGDTAYGFIFSHHHLILDGWSLPLLLAEVFGGYERAGSEENEALAEPARPFRDYIAWLDRQDPEATAAHWQSVLAGFEAPTQLSIDHGAVGDAVGEAGRLSIRLPSGDTDALTVALRSRGLTLNTAVQGAWGLLLAYYGRSTDVVFGVSVAGRPADLEGAETMVGVFTNTLPLRLRLSPGVQMQPWLAELQEQLVALRRFEHSALAEVQKASAIPGGLPLFESLVVFENYPDAEGAAEGTLELTEVASDLDTNYPLLVGANPGDGLSLDLTYDENRFEAVAMERLIRQWRALLGQMVESLDRPWTALSGLTASERHQLLCEWSETSNPSDTSRPGPIHHWIAAQAVETPARLAAVCGEHALTYGELWRRVEALAGRLNAAGVGPEDVVALSLVPSPEQLVALLAVLEAGGAYLPLDPSWPTARLEHLIADASVAAVLTDDASDHQLPALTVPCFRLDGKGQWHGSDAASAKFAVRDETTSFAIDRLAYLIYTSGSTGRPKAVMVRHRGLADYTRDLGHRYGLSEGDRVLQFASLSFDVSAEEIFPTLAQGATVVLRRDRQPVSHEDFLATCARRRLTVLNLPAAYWQDLTAAAVTTPTPPSSLRLVVVGSEKVWAEPLARWREWAPAIRVVNVYGATETTIGATAWQAEGATPAEVPVGRPLADTRIYLVRPDLTASAIGASGELCVAGSGLARGYLGRPSLTATCFVPDPWGDRGSRLYRTGDLARWRDDGQLEVLGRIDHQVKIRGYRVELGEIEAALSTHPEVRAAAVSLGNDPDRPRLAAHVVVESPAEDASSESADLRADLQDFLAARLPEYMTPKTFVFLDRLPTTAGGKVDRRALQAPEIAESDANFIAPQSAAEKALADVWQSVLGVPRVGVEDRFFELGGDSILSLQVVARALRAGFAVTPQQVFEQPTLGALAAVATPAVEALGIPQEPVTGPAPLLPIQRRFLESDPADPHHFNQALMFEVREPMDAECLQAALGRLIDHHDALRLRFEQRDGTWHQTHAPIGGPPPLTVVQLAAWNADRRRREIERSAAAVQGAFDLAHGPLLRAVLFTDGGDGDRLLLVAHHLVIDGVSWRVLLEDLELGYLQLRRSGVCELPPKTTSFRDWSELLQARAAAPEMQAQDDVWRRWLGAPPTPLPADDPEAGNTLGDAGTVTVQLSPEDTEALLREVPAAYDTRIQEALLAALTLALENFAGGDAWWVELEGHGRETQGFSVDLSRTIGWFTHLYPVRLERAPGGIGELMKSTKERLRQVPDGGMSYSLLYPDGGSPRPQILFNYLGQFDQALPEASLLRPAEESTGWPNSPRQAREHLLEVNGGISEGQLSLTWTYGSKIHQQHTVEGLANGYLEALRKVIEHCRAPEAQAYTPSDFPLMDFDQSELDDLAQELVGSVEDTF